ncbi:UvrD-helicase domain-containing protein [Flavobacterium gyeonganense]|uniref:UvrD-helicase domain-containing protein n=1 Tax=Flavobacterium gyeonganense TaxID=1310418 RepID=A0ABV5HDP4_9FLAO|nr:UvrD-helicase domain-containing protein [Flavobacterium gyeonganense]
MTQPIYTNDIDKSVDDEIYTALNPRNPKSFFLFAGAGSGKTRTLVNVLTTFKKNYGHQFRLKRQKVAIITYTNAACNEIIHRLDYHPIFSVSTIHSFSWELIQGLNNDIREWLKNNLVAEIAKLQEEQSRSLNLQNKTSLDRKRRIESKTRRLDNLQSITKFTYDPNGNNSTRDSLSHSEVLHILAYFLNAKPLMRDIMVSRFPILVIDESQDTNKELIESFFVLQKAKKDNFSLGLFGDTMQRIYFDGKENLEKNLPLDWITPSKKMNHRSNKRIVTLVNTIRKEVDKQTQLPRIEKEDGHVRLYIIDRTAGNKEQLEKDVQKKMVAITNDALWNDNDRTDHVKTLILEHHMAAQRMGFSDFFWPLYTVEKLKTGLLEGSLSSLTFFIKIILPLWKAFYEKDEFSIARIAKQFSPDLNKEGIKKNSEGNQIDITRKKIESLLGLWKDNKDPSLFEIIENVGASDLFQIPDPLSTIAYRTSEAKKAAENYMNQSSNEENNDSNEVIDAWDRALQVPFSQIVNYNEYLLETSKFGTHQGVKGLEFDRVMVILDDTASRGNSFSYDKLFGTKPLSQTDKDNIKIGKETGFDKTKRLFYVACSRAKKSLAIVVYSDTPQIVKQNAVLYKWFSESEIEIIQ